MGRKGIYIGQKEKRPLEKPRNESVSNIKMNLGEIGWGGMNWIDLAQNRYQWKAHVNMVMNLWIS
jgi:hypothetical protein